MKAELAGRFQEAIDEAAMRLGDTDADPATFADPDRLVEAERLIAAARKGASARSWWGPRSSRCRPWR